MTAAREDVSFDVHLQQVDRQIEECPVCRSPYHTDTQSLLATTRLPVSCTKCGGYTLCRTCARSNSDELMDCCPSCLQRGGFATPLVPNKHLCRAMEQTRRWRAEVLRRTQNPALGTTAMIRENERLVATVTPTTNNNKANRNDRTAATSDDSSQKTNRRRDKMVVHGGSHHATAPGNRQFREEVTKYCPVYMSESTKERDRIIDRFLDRFAFVSATGTPLTKLNAVKKLKKALGDSQLLARLKKSGNRPSILIQKDNSGEKRAGTLRSSNNEEADARGSSSKNSPMATTTRLDVLPGFSTSHGDRAYREALDRYRAAYLAADSVGRAEIMSYFLQTFRFFSDNNTEGNAEYAKAKTHKSLSDRRKRQSTLQASSAKEANFNNNHSKEPPALFVGQSVYCLWSEKDEPEYYSGKISKIHSLQRGTIPQLSYDVDFDDGDKLHNVDRCHVFSLAEADQKGLVSSNASDNTSERCPETNKRRIEHCSTDLVAEANLVSSSDDQQPPRKKHLATVHQASCNKPSTAFMEAPFFHLNSFLNGNGQARR